MSVKVDCIINVYGKPRQTELALLSLLRYSGDHIDKIFFINENDKLAEHKYITNKPLNIDYFTPKYWNWINPVDTGRLHDDEYRLSVRYQYGWERSDKDFVFITHNDCVYRGDIVGALLGNTDDNIAIGQLGQCWNCPASWAKKCDSESYWNYRPSFNELSLLYHTVEPPSGHVKRPYHVPDFHGAFKMRPWPLPECRVNEWCVLVNLAVAREVTMPKGPAVPFGAILNGGTPILDVAVGWFRDVSRMGHRCTNFPIYNYMSHSAGHPSMYDRDIYARNEINALETLKREYGRKDDGYSK
jgi:hypothetical protein